MRAGRDVSAERVGDGGSPLECGVDFLDLDRRAGRDAVDGEVQRRFAIVADKGVGGREGVARGGGVGECGRAAGDGVDAQVVDAEGLIEAVVVIALCADEIGSGRQRDVLRGVVRC